MLGLLNKRLPDSTAEEQQQHANDSKRGFRNDGKLWILKLHELLTELVGKEEAEKDSKRLKALQEADSIRKTRAKIEATIEEYRKSAKHATAEQVDPGKKKRKFSEGLIDAAEKERVQKLTTLRNIALSFEKLVLNLAIFCFTEDTEDVYSSIKELKTCYQNVLNN